MLDEINLPEFGPYSLSDMQTGDQFDPNLLPKGYYLARLNCGNCSAGVYLNIARGFEVPDATPDLPCPHCEVAGHIYAPISEKDYVKEVRKRLEEREDNA